MDALRLLDALIFKQHSAGCVTCLKMSKCDESEGEKHCKGRRIINLPFVTIITISEVFDEGEKWMYPVFSSIQLTWRGVMADPE